MQKSRGYFGIGIYHTKTRQNIGTLWRSASQLNASFIFTIGERYRRQSSDTVKAYRHIPLYKYTNFQDFQQHRPYDCPLIGIEMQEKSVDLDDFKHPERAVYLLGAEDTGLPPAVIKECQHLISMDSGGYSFNVAVAGSLVLYDRKRKNAKV